ncbi:hypothetical protein Tco_0769323 [Tanacetum coccineum]|uniref:Reverse transcriptase domain-containing protein n=1 Tax=Tanacetum coccineum TaxID=301880 RepID=A0ABQ4Z9Z2_9ASTR
MDSFQGLTKKFPHHGIDLWIQVQIFYDHVNPAIRRTIDQSAGGKLRNKNAKESWALSEDLTLYDNESWNDLRDFAKRGPGDGLGKGRRGLEGPREEGVNGNVKGSQWGCTRLLDDHCLAIAEPLTRHASSGCSYKEFLACNLKEYDGKGGVVVLTHWIEKMENIQDMSGCSNDQKVKYTAGSFVGKALTCHEMQKLESELWNHTMVGAGHVAYTDRFHELARLVPYLVTPKSRMIKRSACPRLNRAQEPKRNHPNQVAANNGGQGHGNQGNQARGRAFMLGAEEARQDPNIVTASGQLVEIDKVIKGCKLEIEGHVFDIDLIPFGHGSFDVIIGERPEEKVRLFMSAKASDKKQEEIIVVRDFPEVFPDDLFGLPPIQEIEFRIELIPRATPVAKFSTYRLAPSGM